MERIFLIIYFIHLLLLQYDKYKLCWKLALLLNDRLKNFRNELYSLFRDCLKYFSPRFCLVSTGSKVIKLGSFSIYPFDRFSIAKLSCSLKGFISRRFTFSMFRVVWSLLTNHLQHFAARKLRPEITSFINPVPDYSR